MDRRIARQMASELDAPLRSTLHDALSRKSRIRLIDTAVISPGVSEARLADATMVAVGQESIPRASGLCTPPRLPSNVPVVPRDRLVGQLALALPPARPRSAPSTWRTADDRARASVRANRLVWAGCVCDLRPNTSPREQSGV